MKRQDLIFAFMPAYRGAEVESLMLAHSIRAFAGELRNNPIWVLIPQSVETLSTPTRRELLALDAQLIPFDVERETLEFWFGGKVIASAAAESLAQTDLLVWMDSDTLVLNEPTEFRLDAGKHLGCRPVMLKNISSPYDEPLNRFWELVYRGCNTPPERIFPLTTTVDGVRIRAQFNAGLSVVRPEHGLLRAWCDNFLRLYREPQWDEFYKQHILYRIFIHQAILAATILAQLSQSEIQDFSDRVNYPMFLHNKYPVDRRSNTLNEVVTCRYDEFSFFEERDWRNILAIEEPLGQWLEEMVRSGQPHA
jgi:hypothetical protein